MTVNLPSGGGGGGVPQVIQLQDARPFQIPPPPTPPTNRCKFGSPFVVRAVDLARDMAPAHLVQLVFTSPDAWGYFVDDRTLTTLTNQDGLAAARFVSGDTAGTHPIVVTALYDASVPPLVLSAEATEPSLDSVADVQVEPGSGAPNVIRVHAWASAAQGTNLTNEVVSIVMVDAQGQEAPVDQSMFLLLPEERSTDASGTANFVLDATPSVSPGTYTLRAKLIGWPESTDFHVTVLDPSALTLPLGSITGGVVRDRNVYLSVVSGNGQIGAVQTALGSPLSVQLMQNGSAVGPISESYPRYDQNGNRLLPDYELHIRKVDFGLVQGSGTLSPASGTQVDLDNSGQASANLTYGGVAEPQFVCVSLVVEWGLPPNLGATELPGGAVFAEAAREARFVSEAPPRSGSFVRDRGAEPFTVLAPDGSQLQVPPGATRWVELTSADLGPTIHATLTTLDECGEVTSLANGVAASQMDIVLTPASIQPAPGRYVLYRSAPLVVTDQTVEGINTSPLSTLSDGRIVVQGVPTGRLHAQFDEVAEITVTAHEFTPTIVRVSGATDAEKDHITLLKFQAATDAKHQIDRYTIQLLAGDVVVAKVTDPPDQPFQDNRKDPVLAQGAGVPTTLEIPDSITDETTLTVRFIVTVTDLNKANPQSDFQDVATVQVSTRVVKMARALASEAASQGKEGLRGVANVIRNRALNSGQGANSFKGPDFSDTVFYGKDVQPKPDYVDKLFQVFSAPGQFSSLANQLPTDVLETTEDARQVALELINKTLSDNVGGAMHFRSSTKATSPNVAWDRTKHAADFIGDLLDFTKDLKKVRVNGKDGKQNELIFYAPDVQLTADHTEHVGRIPADNRVPGATNDTIDNSLH